MTEYLHSFTKLEFDKILARVSSLAATDLGKAGVQRLQPLPTSSDVRLALRQVSEMKQLLQSGLTLPFEGVVDCTLWIRRTGIQGEVLSAPELRDICNLISAARRIKSFLERKKEEFPNIADLASKITFDKILEYNIANAISEKGDVQDSASKKLNLIRAQIGELRGRLKKKLESLLKNAVKHSLAQDEIVTTREGRMVIPVKAEHKQHIPGFIHSSSASGATVFIEPAETLSFNNEIRSLLFEEEREIYRILKDLTQQVGSKSSELINTIELIKILDEIYAKAKYSQIIGGAEVNIHDSLPLTIRQARHPLLIEQISYDNVVPFDIRLGDNVYTIVLSGPNAGGKSVVLKAIGLIATMVHHGMHAPVSPDSSLPFIQKIFVDIGDEQSIESNLSTFTSHLQKLKLITEQSDTSSLVLIDEVCAGTDPAEGGAIAAAILHKLTEAKSLNIVTTHNTLLKTLAHHGGGMLSASMEFNAESLTPTFYLQSGIIGSSYALEVAQRINLQQDILVHARTLLGEDAHHISDLLLELQKERSALRQERESIEAKLKAVTQQATTYQLKIASVDREIRELRKRSLEEAREIISDAQRFVEQRIKELREHQRDPQMVQGVKARIKEEKNRLESLAEPEAPLQADFSVGEYVKFKNGSAVGEIIEIVDNNNVIVVTNNLKIKSPKKNLEHTTSNHRPQVSANVPEIPSQREIDVRGLVARDAIDTIDKFLDSAVLTGLARVTIIHGKGSGILRTKIHDYLSKHKQVKSFAVAEWNEGGWGATTVELF